MFLLRKRVLHVSQTQNTCPIHKKTICQDPASYYRILPLNPGCLWNSSLINQHTLSAELWRVEASSGSMLVAGSEQMAGGFGDKRQILWYVWNAIFTRGIGENCFLRTHGERRQIGTERKDDRLNVFVQDESVPFCKWFSVYFRVYSIYSSVYTIYGIVFTYLTKKEIIRWAF